MGQIPPKQASVSPMQTQAPSIENQSTLSRVFSKWRKVATDACKSGAFTELQFTLRIRDGAPHTHVVTRTDSELVVTD